MVPGLANKRTDDDERFFFPSLSQPHGRVFFNEQLQI